MMRSRRPACSRASLFARSATWSMRSFYGDVANRTRQGMSAASQARPRHSRAAGGRRDQSPRVAPRGRARPRRQTSRGAGEDGRPPERGANAQTARPVLAASVAAEQDPAPSEDRRPAPAAGRRRLMSKDTMPSLWVVPEARPPGQRATGLRPDGLHTRPDSSDASGHCFVTRCREATCGISRS